MPASNWQVLRKCHYIQAASRLKRLRLPKQFSWPTCLNSLLAAWIKLLWGWCTFPHLKIGPLAVPNQLISVLFLLSSSIKLIKFSQIILSWQTYVRQSNGETGGNQDIHCEAVISRKHRMTEYKRGIPLQKFLVSRQEGKLGCVFILVYLSTNQQISSSCSWEATETNAEHHGPYSVRTVWTKMKVYSPP